MRIGYQGRDGSWSRKAAGMLSTRNFDGVNAAAPELVALDTSANVAAKLLTGDVDYGVLALLNNRVGLVGETKVALSNMDYRIVDSITIDITHNLYQRASSKDFNRIVGHQQGLSQCREYLDRFYPGLARVAVPEGLAYLQTKITATDLVITPPLATLPEGIALEAEDIQGETNNQTLFLLIKLAK